VGDGNRERLPEFSDHWLWFVDDQYVHSPLGVDVLDQEDHKRGVDMPVLARALALNGEGKTVDALKEVASALRSGENAPELYWAEGQLEFELGRYEESLTAYEKVLAIRPQNRGATFNVALCLEKLRRYAEAAERFREVTRLDPQLLAARIGLGSCLLHLDQPDAALHEFVWCTEKEPTEERALTGAGAALHSLGKYDEAFDLYVRVLRSYPHDPGLLGNLIAVSAARQDERRLRDYAETLLKMKPGARLALEGLITAAFLRNNYDVAAYYGAQYVKAFPDSYEGWFNHGVALQKTGQIEKAANAYQQAMRIRPDGQEALANLAAILHENDDLSRARQAYERVLELNPDHAGTLWNLGLLYQKSGNGAEAEKCYASLVKLKPGHEEARLRLGYLRLERSDFPGAIEALEQIATKPRARSEAQVNLAIAYWRSGQCNAAKTLLQKALEDRPDAVEFQRILAVVAVSEGNLDEAVKWEAMLAQLGESMPELSYNVGVLLQDAARYDDAARALERAVQGKPRFGEALLNLGHALKGLGQEERAKECWREAVEAMPELAGGYFEAAPVL